MLLIFCSVLISVNFSSAQSLKINPKSFNMVISGTTNVHDFETKVTQINGEIVLGETNQVQSMIVNIPVKSIRSKEKLMDTKTYEAFNADKNPNITFKLIEVSALEMDGENINVVLTGNITMAGFTKKITIKSSGKKVKQGAYQFKGSIALKMTDFKMTPPTAMMGLMRVGDAVTIKYDALFEGAQLTQN